MAQIVSLLNGENINQDHQITALHKALINPGVISGLAVTSGQVQPGEAFVECTRSNGEKIMVLFQLTAPMNIDTTTNNQHIFIQIRQENIDNGILNTEDGSNIGVIAAYGGLPDRNVLELARTHGNTLTDIRKFIGKKIPDIRGQNRKPIDYNSQTYYGPEFLEGATVGLSDAWWINLHTYCSWHNHEPQFTTQLAITAHGAPGIWIRKAQDNNTWQPWQKVFPFSATALDINGLPEIINSTSAYDFFVVKEFTGQNKKVTLENLRKWTLPQTKPNNVNWGNTSSLHLPNGGIVTLYSYGTDGYSTGACSLEYSTNNQDWVEVGKIYWQGIFTAVISPGFIRTSGSFEKQYQYLGRSVQLF